MTHHYCEEGCWVWYPLSQRFPFHLKRHCKNLQTTCRFRSLPQDYVDWLNKDDVTEHQDNFFNMMVESGHVDHYKKYCILPGVEALEKCRKPWQMDVCQEFCQEQNPQQICSSQMTLPGLKLLANALLAQALAKPLANCVCKIAGFSDVFWSMQAFADDHISHFQTMPGKLPGVNPWQNVYEFIFKNIF